MEERLNVWQKLLSVQCDLKAPKSQYNDFGKYNYRNAEDILEAVKPICAKYRAVTILTDKITVVGDRYYVEATARFIDIDEGNVIEVNASAREEETKKGMDGSQVTGAASSYARKYALNGLFAIDDTKDSDATNNGDKQPEKPQNAPKPSNKPTEPKKAEKTANAPAVKGFNDELPFPMEDIKSHSQEIAEILVKQEYIDRLKKKMTETYGTDDFDSLNDFQFRIIKSVAEDFRKKVYGV